MTRNNRLTSFAAAAFFAASLFCSCESENALAIVNQEAKIDTYITSNYKDNEVVRNGGSNRVIVSAGDSTAFVEKGDTVSLNLVGHVFTGTPSTEFYSSDVTLPVDEKNMMEGLCNGLVGATPYEESVILFSAKYGYYNSAVGLVPAMSSLMFKVTVLNIVKKN